MQDRYKSIKSMIKRKLSVWNKDYISIQKQKKQYNVYFLDLGPFVKVLI
jgi:hypothetical protein